MSVIAADFLLPNTTSGVIQVPGLNSSGTVRVTELISSGPVTCLQNPSSPNELATKNYVDSVSVGGLYYATPESFGAVGDGVHDDTPAVISVLQLGKSVLFGQDKTYKVTESSIAFNGDNMVIDLNGSTINWTDGPGVLFRISHTTGAPMELRNGVIIDTQTDNTSGVYHIHVKNDTRDGCIDRFTNMKFIRQAPGSPATAYATLVHINGMGSTTANVIFD